MAPARPPLPAVLVVLLASLVAACAGPDTAGVPVSPAPAASVSTPADAPTSADGSVASPPNDPVSTAPDGSGRDGSASTPPDGSGPTPPGAAVPAAAARRVVVLDPGHNAGNARHPAAINKQVPDGRGGTKPCNTVGTSTNAGYPEHEFNWKVAQDVRATLQSHGVTVVMSRTGDPAHPRDEDPNGVGPCVDVRGTLDAKVGADLSVSIHGDGAPAADHGFALYYAQPALNSAQGKPSIALAETLRAALTAQRLTVAAYAGVKGLKGRPDLGGLNLATRPSVLIECGNMRNAQDAATMTSAAGQARIAQGIATGILTWLAAHPRQ